MNRREILAASAASLLIGMETPAAPADSSYLELKIWRLHTTPEGQGARVEDFLEHGLTPALSNAGAQLIGAFSILIGPDSPSYITITEFASLGAMQETIMKLRRDDAYRAAVHKLSVGSGLPFVRLESSILRSFDTVPQARIPSDTANRPPRIFEMRTYESQTFEALERKISMFNPAEVNIFDRLKMRPVFFGETIAGPKQPNLTYMLSFDNLAERDQLWAAFVSDPEWQKLRIRPGFEDPQTVSNISNMILQPLRFSPVR
jgi:hypothetical protein